jgi:hypothetical protein
VKKAAVPAVIADNLRQVFRAAFTSPIRWIATMAAMRFAFIFVGLFIFIVADITANHGAALRGWMTFLTSVARSIGLA